MALRQDITKLIDSIPLADTHEHLYEETERFTAEPGQSYPYLRDIGALFYNYSNSDLAVAGMPRERLDRLFAPDVSIQEKWRSLKPYYERCKHTGYLQAVRISIQTLYGEDLTDESYRRINDRFIENMKPGLTRRVLKDHANVDHCQVNAAQVLPFRITEQPDLLLQDISLTNLMDGWNKDEIRRCAGGEFKTLDDYHQFMDGLFERHSGRACGIKIQHNYSRMLDFDDVPAHQVDKLFERALREPKQINDDERKLIQDHLFNYGVRKATQHGLPVKLHCGYYAGHNWMPMRRISQNACNMTDLLMRHPETSFVFMHINYPNQSELIAVCKQFSNAYADMCWAWGINPAASVRFLKEFLMAVPANKILTFGGDVTVVENVVGYAAIARQGISQALAELSQEGWVRESEIEPLANRIMRGNARELFRIEEKFGL